MVAVHLLLDERDMLVHATPGRRTGGPDKYVESTVRPQNVRTLPATIRSVSL